MAKRKQLKSLTAKAPKITYVGTEDVPAYYTNNTRVETSRFDVRLRFGNIIETNKETNGVTVRYLADLRMSLEHAKVIAKILAEQIRTYEETFGKIPGAKDE